MTGCEAALVICVMDDLASASDERLQFAIEACRQLTMEVQMEVARRAAEEVSASGRIGPCFE